ncbi:hypothetical protein [Alteromonas mediterranea]|uniref:hypothetical protein n=1 Tax=Alteromonas mediterranea TaxID=314275 RepID=UPI0012F7FDBB|nr:hypothetical protein [Alteromonas mediterranea]QGX63081.1 hypothetical protein FJN15_15440 [Alteromonas mediterranea]
MKDLEQNIREQATSNTYGISKPELEISDIKLDFGNSSESVYLSMTLTNNTNLYIDRGYVDVEFNSDSAGKIPLSESEFFSVQSPLGPNKVAAQASPSTNLEVTRFVIKGRRVTNVYYLLKNMEL